jgi:PAS domain S-box-containing protein
MESRYSGLVQGLPVVVFSLDDTLELTFVNEACRTVLGWTPDQALLEPGWFMDNVFPEDRERVRGAFTGAFAASTPFSLEFRMVNPRGVPLFVQARSTAVASPDLARGMPGRIEGVLIDLSRRVFLERLLARWWTRSPTNSATRSLRWRALPAPCAASFPMPTRRRWCWKKPPGWRP